MDHSYCVKKVAFYKENGLKLTKLKNVVYSLLTNVVSILFYNKFDSCVFQIIDATTVHQDGY